MFNFLIKANHESESKKTELLLKNEDIIYALSSTSRIDYQALKILTKQNNLTLQKINSYSDDYAKTLFMWRNNFLKAWDNITPLGFDEHFKRMWEFYLSYCEAGFKSKNIDLIQFSLSNR